MRTAKSHSLSSREVQESRGRWYVTERRSRMKACRLDETTLGVRFYNYMRYVYHRRAPHLIPIFLLGLNHPNQLWGLLNSKNPPIRYRIQHRSCLYNSVCVCVFVFAHTCCRLRLAPLQKARKLHAVWKWLLATLKVIFLLSL